MNGFAFNRYSTTVNGGYWWISNENGHLISEIFSEPRACVRKLAYCTSLNTPSGEQLITVCVNYVEKVHSPTERHLYTDRITYNLFQCVSSTYNMTFLTFLSDIDMKLNN